MDSFRAKRRDGCPTRGACGTNARAKGGDFNNIKNALLTLLGDSFVQYIVTQYAGAVLYPATIGDQPMNLVTPTRQPKLLSLTNAISTGLGAPAMGSLRRDRYSSGPRRKRSPKTFLSARRTRLTRATTSEWRRSP